MSLKEEVLGPIRTSEETVLETEKNFDVIVPSTDKEFSSLSKNAQKRLLKKQRFEATRPEWKAKMKEKERLKKLKQKEERSNETNNIRASSIPSIIQQEAPSGRILIDLAFEHLMRPSELVSLVNQICRCYSINKKGTVNPYELSVAGFTGSTSDILKNNYPGYLNWNMKLRVDDLKSEILNSEGPVVYLSADAEDVLDEIDPNTTYVIGGLIDRNRYKNIAAERASSLGLRSVKLPLADHIKLCSSQVLTIVHVYELLCKRRDLNSWDAAINAVIPQRKRSENNTE